MSQKPLQTLWGNTQIKLSRLLASDLSVVKGFEDKRQANDYVRRLFVKYNDILKKLDEIYETTVHPQKRSIIRMLLDGIVGRLIELKEEMIKFDGCEYTYFEDLALDQNKTLDDLRLHVPRYFAQDRFKAIEQRNQTITMILNRLNQSKNDLSSSSSFDALLSSPTEQGNSIMLATAVRVLQAHERARQGRVHAYFMHRMKKEMKTTETKSIVVVNNDEHAHLNNSCLILQTVWRQKYAEKVFERKKTKEATLLGMILPRRSITVDDSDTTDRRQEIQLQHEREFQEASTEIKQKIRQYEETEVKSRLEYVLLQWLLESRQLYGEFPIYPVDDGNGSAVLFKEMTVAEVQEFVEKQAQALKSKKKNKKKEMKKAVIKTPKKQTKQKTNTNELEPSKFVPHINTQMSVYKELFHQRDESYNEEQHYDRLLVMEQLRPEVENELRADVDQLLRNELIYLRLAVDNSEEKQAKKQKKKKKKRKKKRNKKVKDIIANRTTDSIFEELVETGIILPTRAVHQQDFIGDYQYLAETLRYNENEPMPSLLDCLQLVILQIVFPLCSHNVHLHLPPRKGVLLAGPRGSGKELLVHIACNELGGLLLDLSPATLAKSFNTAGGLKMLFTMIKRLVATMPPVLCLIRDSEVLFSKKLTAQEKESEPSRLRRLIGRFIKKMKPGERMMFIGLSSQPHRARIKPLLRIYEHIILFPRPNYGSRRKIFYEYLIVKHNMNINDVELSILASISKGYTAGQIHEIIERLIHTKQKYKHSSNDCTANDFLPLFALQTPVFLDEEDRIKNWYAKTPNGLKRSTELAQTSATKPSSRRRT